MTHARTATLDGLRGVAIALVVWYHLWQITWQAAVIPVINVSLQPFGETGFLGVALFFFISGSVLTLPYARAQFLAEPRPSLRHFVGRRLCKIVPSYVLSIGVLLALGYQAHASTADVLKDVLLHLLFVHDWFAATTAGINGVMWSLAVEVQFYVIFPLLGPAFVRRPVLATIVLFSLANGWRLWCMFSSHYFYGQRLEQLPAYIDLFAAGMLTAYAYVAIGARRPQLAARTTLFSLLMIVGILAFVLLVHDCFAHRYEYEWPHFWVVRWRSAVAVTFIFTALGSLYACRSLRATLTNPPLLFLAAISYNLYLWHQPLARELLKWRIPPFTSADPHDDPHWRLLFGFIAIPLAVALSTAITYFYERPILRLGTSPAFSHAALRRLAFGRRL